ncbi:MAG: flagellar basal body L-ring protein FlgH [Alphaproteobacteria bacterium]|nr:flagellar basal body L-ring protein FlgH [Alphaproteobacteria bacterium]MBQ7285459.1 flagellar basal body L-ring protein FlgH [Alphaproteobacteria bacterium]
MMKNNQQVFTKGIAALLLATSLSGCGMWNRLQQVGKEPPLTPIENPTAGANYQPVSMPMPQTIDAKAAPNSLWKPGSTGFFRDQRASKVGDIITVIVSAKDNALMENEMEQNRDDNKDSMGINAFAGYETYLNDYLPDAVNPAAMLDINSNREISADGKVDRKEKIEMTMAAMVTQVLPNGNLVIEGTQEIRVSYELRRLTMKGIIRRADITSNNTIESSKIAELRVSYGGQGVVSDVQQPRYGRQILDIIAPF